MKRWFWFIPNFFFPTLGMNLVDIPSQLRIEYEQMCKSNFMRSRLLFMFEKHIPFKELPQELSVAILGGSKDEPELFLLEARGFKLKVTLLGIEESDVFLDINVPVNGNQLGKFDLVLCSQVLEHVWNHDNSLRIFEILLNPEGYLWITCPASNRYHGSPEYYVAGFHANYFAKKLETSELQILSCGTLGTRRNYFATHTLPAWLSVQGHRFPLLHAFDNRVKFFKLAMSVRFLVYTMLASIHSPRLTTDSRCATETWVAAKLSRDSHKN